MRQFLFTIKYCSSHCPYIILLWLVPHFLAIICNIRQVSTVFCEKRNRSLPVIILQFIFTFFVPESRFARNCILWILSQKNTFVWWDRNCYFIFQEIYPFDLDYDRCTKQILIFLPTSYQVGYLLTTYKAALVLFLSILILTLLKL